MHYCSYHKRKEPCSNFSKRRNTGLQSYCKEARREIGDIRKFTPRSGERRKSRGRNSEIGDMLSAWRRVKTLVDAKKLPDPHTVPCHYAAMGECSNHREYHHPYGYDPPNDERVEAVCRRHHKLIRQNTNPLPPSDVF